MLVLPQKIQNQPDGFSFNLPIYFNRNPVCLVMNLMVFQYSMLIDSFTL